MHSVSYYVLRELLEKNKRSEKNVET